MVRALAVIPARYESSRFHGKPLAPLLDGTLIERVWRRVIACSEFERVLVATDDDRIAKDCERFGARVAMTRGDHVSGTDRIAEVVASDAHARDDAGNIWDVVVNVQGDEPLVTASALARLVGAFHDPDVRVATLVEPARDVSDVFDPNVVKVARSATGDALYFSRSPIPYVRADETDDLREALARDPERLASVRIHQGLYAYRPATLLEVAGLPASPLEISERLEQLRILEAGIPIRTVESDFRSVGVDTPEDLARVAAMLATRDPSTAASPSTQPAREPAQGSVGPPESDR